MLRLTTVSVVLLESRSFHSPHSPLSTCGAMGDKIKKMQKYQSPKRVFRGNQFSAAAQKSADTAQPALLEPESSGDPAQFMPEPEASDDAAPA